VHVAETKVVLPNGTEITVSGTADEVAAVVLKLTSLSASSGNDPAPRVREPRKLGPKAGAGISGRILELRNGGFFSEARSLREIQNALKEKGHIYPVTSISPTVLGLVRKSDLRRMKSKTGKWTYVRP
jgi:hypothetical protein